MDFHFSKVKIMKAFYICFMLLFMISICEALKLNVASQKLEDKRILSRSNRTPLKSIKSPDGDTIDCVHISHQPAFDHPLLINHTIQMRPNCHPERLFGESKMSNFKPHKNDDTKPIIQLWHSNGRCPEGTIPIRRTNKAASSTKGFAKKKHKITRRLSSQDSVQTKFINPTAGHEYAIAYVGGNQYYGTEATINVWQPETQLSNEFSLSQVWVVGGPDSNLNTVEAGWIVYPQLFGDNNTRLFVYWTSDDYQSTGCYNLLCPGFVQTSNAVALGGSINPVSTNNGPQYEITILVWKDKQQDVWWLKYETEILGYWPASLFTYLAESSSLIEWGGEIVNLQSGGLHTTTKMGSGNFPEAGFKQASYFKNLQVVDGSNTLTPPGAITSVARQPDCYNILSGQNNDSGDFFYYGGPGRNIKCP